MEYHEQNVAEIKLFLDLKEKGIAMPKMMLMKWILHCSDISNPTKNSKIASEWANRVIEEFHRMSDYLKSKNLSLANPLYERTQNKKATIQLNFINAIVQPSFDLLGQLLDKYKQENPE